MVWQDYDLRATCEKRSLHGRHYILTGSAVPPDDKSSLLDTYGHDIVHDLQVSPDGKTATITQSMTIDLSSPGSDMYNKISFGQVTISQRLVVDLTAEIPTVTDFSLSQEFDW